MANPATFEALLDVYEALPTLLKVLQPAFFETIPASLETLQFYLKSEIHPAASLNLLQTLLAPSDTLQPLLKTSQ